MSRALAEISELVRQQTGIALPPSRQVALAAAVRRAAPDLTTAAFGLAAADPVRGPDLVARLIDEVTTQETSFARDLGQLAAVDWQRLLHSARQAGSPAIRVWSAGCATGEEPYTLALLASEAFAPGRVPADILGTDISGSALAAAADGRYRERAVGSLPEPLRRRYLDRQADAGYLAGPRLRGLVRFRRHNLARDPIPPPDEAGFDLVVCRNVLIYFEQPLTGRVIGALERSLRPGGMLVLGAADALGRPGGRPAARAAPGPTEIIPAGQPLPPTPRRHAAGARQQRLAAALDAAGQGDRDGAMAAVASLLAEDPLDADAQYVTGLFALEAGDPLTAAAALRRAIYVDASFALALFALGRAYDAMGDCQAAQRAYRRVLRTLDPDDHRRELLLRQVHPGDQVRPGDIAEACRVRLAGR